MSTETSKREKLIPETETTQTAQTEKNAKELRPARQKGSVLERTAFWSSLVMTVLLVGFFFITKALSGISSQQLIFLTFAGLICTVLLLIKNRWVMIVTTLAEAYLFYMIWTQPFVVESLSNPKGPDGGLGHFSGDVLIICASLLALICCIGATIQHFQFKSKSRPTPRWYPVVLGLVIGIAVGAMHIGAISLPPSAATTGLTYTNGVPTLHMSASGFLQSSITISKGSKLLLVDDSSEKHDLFNGVWQNATPVVEQEPGAPLVNDVKLSSDSTTIGPFNTAGTFHIFCTLHQGMSLTIIVQ